MIIKQHSTRFDDFLLKVAFPILHEIGLARLLPSFGIWHRSMARQAVPVSTLQRAQPRARQIPDAQPIFEFDRRRAA